MLFTAAATAGLMPSSTASLLVAIVTLTMALTPIGSALSRRLLKGDDHEELDEDFAGAGADVLMVGFSRFGQIAAQILLAGVGVFVVAHHFTSMASGVKTVWITK